MSSIVSIDNLTKTSDGGFQALKGVTLDIEEGEILSLLGPNGAGKTTLISIICGITNPSTGRVTVGGHDIISDFRAARRLLGLVPQEINLQPLERVMNTVRFTRGLFGQRPDDAYLEKILTQLSLWDKRDAQINALSGGMKRRVLIAKALSHNPRVLFLDEPTAGVDVELRKDMWETVRELQAEGVTIILTTHYIEEAEAMSDRIGVIAKGELMLVEEKTALMNRMGQKRMRIDLQVPLPEIPSSLAQYNLSHGEIPSSLVYDYDAKGERTGITRLLNDLSAAGIVLRDVQTSQSSLEDIFVSLVGDRP